MPFGSIFGKFREFNATTADEKIINIKNNFFTRLGFRFLGVPHLGIRLRARKIIKNSPKKIINMLDAGCGTGVYSFYFSKFADKIESIDISEEKIEYLSKENIFKNINFSKGDICKLPFGEGVFDFIVCSDVLEHVKNDKKAFKELSRIIRKNGTLLITVPYDSKSNRSSYKRYNHERAGYLKGDILKLIKNKFKIEKASGYSYPAADCISNFSYRFTKNMILLGVLFYPLYFLSIFFDSLKIGEPNGLFIKLKKV
jgi:ubiquinone/menaquinone biosynthesis C-methylase UbiE